VVSGTGERFEGEVEWCDKMAAARESHLRVALSLLESVRSG
jgi:hypothetical protein